MNKRLISELRNKKKKDSSFYTKLCLTFCFPRYCTCLVQLSFFHAGSSDSLCFHAGGDLYLHRQMEKTVAKLLKVKMLAVPALISLNSAARGEAMLVFALRVGATVTGTSPTSP